MQAALEQGSRDNATALVVRVLGVLDGLLQDENRLAQQLPIPPRLKVGDAIDGLTVTALVADNGINMLYQVRDPATPQAVRAQDPAPAPRARCRRSAPCWRTRPGWPSACVRAGRPRTWWRVVDPLVQAPSGFYLLYDWHGGETLQQMLDRKHKFTLSQTVAAATHVARALSGCTARA